MLVYTYSKLLRIGPCHFGKFLDSDPPLVLKATLINDIGGFLPTLGDDVVGAEVVGGGLELRERELGESAGGGGAVD